METEDTYFAIGRVIRTIEGLPEKLVLEYTAQLSSIRDEQQLTFLTQELLEGIHKIPSKHADAIVEAARVWKSRSHKRKHGGNDFEDLKDFAALLKKMKVTTQQGIYLAQLYRKSYKEVAGILASDNSDEDKLTMLLSLVYGNPVVPWEEQFVSQIKSYWSDSDFVFQVILSIGKLDLPYIPTPKLYCPKSKYLKHDLPCSVRQDALDLTILPGDLDNPNVMPEVVRDVIANIESTVNNGFFHTNLLLGPSAIGKTKALFDIATVYYTIFINGIYEESGRVEKDIANMMENLTKQEVMEEECAYEILLVTVSRVVALLYLLTVGAIQSPSDWRNVQLSGLSTTDFDKFLSPIQFCIRRQYSSTKDLQELQTNLCGVHLQKFKRPVCVAVDDANIFIEAKTSNGEKPLWTLLRRTLSSINTTAFLIAGTTIALSNNEDVLVSCIAKETGKQLNVRTNFRHTKPAEISAFLNRIFVNLPQNAHDLFCSRLYGRMRFVTAVASRIEENPNTDPKAIVVQYINELQSLGKKWTIASSLHCYYEKYGVACVKSLQKILLSVYLNYGTVRYDANQIDWLTGGVCRVVSTGVDPVYKFDEPLVIECIEKFLDCRSISVTDCLSRFLMEDMLVNASAKGVLLDSLLQLALMKNTRPSFIAAILPDLPIQVDFEEYSVIHSTLTSYLKNPTKKILAPSTRIGPDVIYFVDPSVIILFSNCTTTVRSSVLGTKVNDSVLTTNIGNICAIKKDGTRVVDTRIEDSIFSTLEEISQLIKNGLKHVIRVHLALPGAPKTVPKDVFNPGHYSSYSHTIIYNTQNKSTKSFSFTEHTVSIDSSCLKLSNLFSPQTLENILTLYPNKQTRPVMDWTKVAAPDLVTEIPLYDGSKESTTARIRKIEMPSSIAVNDKG